MEPHLRFAGPYGKEHITKELRRGIGRCIIYKPFEFRLREGSLGQGSRDVRNPVRSRHRDNAPCSLHRLFHIIYQELAANDEMICRGTHVLLKVSHNVPFTSITCTTQELLVAIAFEQRVLGRIVAGIKESLTQVAGIIPNCPFATLWCQHDPGRLEYLFLEVRRPGNGFFAVLDALAVALRRGRPLQIPSLLTHIEGLVERSRWQGKGIYPMLGRMIFVVLHNGSGCRARLRAVQR